MTKSRGRPTTQPTIIKTNDAVLLKSMANVAAQKMREYTIHMIPFARLYAGMSDISVSSTSDPAQNYIGFFLFQAYTPSAVNNALHGIMMIYQIRLSISLSPQVMFLFLLYHSQDYAQERIWRNGRS